MFPLTVKHLSGSISRFFIPQNHNVPVVICSNLFSTSQPFDEKTKKDPNANRKLKYANDPEYRARQRQINREYYEDNQLARQRKNACAKAWNTNNREVLSATRKVRWNDRSPEWRQMQRDLRSARRRAEGENVREKIRLWVETRKRENPDAYKRMLRQRNMHIWLSRSERVRQLDWPTHIPIKYHAKKEHFCHTCNTHKNVLLWMKRKGHDDLYDCLTCFNKNWPNNSPLGYEGIFAEDGRMVKGFKPRNS